MPRVARDSIRRALSSKRRFLGRGIALAKSTLAQADLAARRLVAPFASTRPIDFAYYIVAPKSKLNLPKVSHFCDWLRAEAASHDQEKAVA